MPSTDASAAAPHNCQSCEVAVQAAMVLAESLQASQRALHAAEQTDSSFPATRQLVIDSVEKAFRKLAAEAQVPLNSSDNLPDMGALVSAFAGTTISGGPAMENLAGDATMAPEPSDKPLSSLGLSDIPCGPGNNYSTGSVATSSGDHDIAHSEPSAPLIPSSAVSHPDQALAPEQVPTEHVPPEQRWYAVFVGREPGVYQGYHNVAHNVQGIPNGAQQRCVSERSAWEAFKQALDGDRVVRVTISVQETRLSCQDFDL
ncbi:hypothetical protein H0H92_012941 [Tricholoma furcatifolium]|nr:hypothetical protein H0H92_012941 [Tricholoma furcatifolium]